MNRHRDKGRLGPFVPLLRDTIATPAWKAMSHGARSLYVALRAKYSGNSHNNGWIFLSQRDAAEHIGSHHNEIARWFRELQFYGFIVLTNPHSLGVDGRGKAPHWRLTELGYMREPPSRDFARWNGQRFRNRKLESRAPFPAHPVLEMEHTSVPEMAHAQKQKRAGNGAHMTRRHRAPIPAHTKHTTPPAPSSDTSEPDADQKGAPRAHAHEADLARRLAPGGSIDETP